MKKDKNYQSDIDLKEYHDSSGVSLKEMSFGLWIAQKRKLFIKLFIAALIAVSAFFFIYSGYHYIVYFITGQDDFVVNEGMVSAPRQLVDNLEVDTVSVLSSYDDYDLAVSLKNPNDRFSASFSYCFKAAETEISCGRSFILPQETKMLVALSQEMALGETATFAIKEISWLRVNTHQIPSWPDFAASRLDFAIINPIFSSGARSGLSDKLSFNNLSFTISNQTAYGYYQLNLNILLYSGGQLVGVNRHALFDFQGGESRSVSLSWPGNLSGVTRVDIIPEVNVLDDSVYLKYSGATR